MKPKRAGFTMLELMVVVVIMGVLATMAIPKAGKTVENTRVDQAAAELHSIWGAQRRYRMQHQDFAPDLKTLVDGGYLQKALLEKKEPFQFAVQATRSGGLRMTATRTGSGWSGELVLDEMGDLKGSVRNGGGDEVKP